MKKGFLGKWLAGAALAAAIGAMSVFPAFAGSVGSLRLTFTNTYEIGEVIEPQVSCRNSGVSIESVEWSRELENWKPGQKITATITLDSDDSFASSYTSKTCIISGASFSSAQRDSGKLIVKAVYYPVTQLEAPESAGWRTADKTTASWKKVDYAPGYQLNLYFEDEFIRTFNVKNTKLDLSEYMTKEGYYYYEVRAAALESSDLRYYKSSEYTVSSDSTMEDLGDTEGKWKNYTAGKKYQKENGDNAANEWYRILGEWYYFDENEYAVTGWKLVGPTWYYMDENGVMETGWVQVGDKWYYMNADGAMQTGWIQGAPGQWHYLGADGAMAVNTVVDGYVIDANGVWKEN